MRKKGEPHRYKFMSRYRGYHGNTMATMAATGQAQRRYQYEPFASGFFTCNAARLLSYAWNRKREHL